MSRQAASTVPVRTKRWNDPREAEDGYRLLICRFRPRGVSKEDETWDAWCQALAPSAELHAAAYGKGQAPIAFEEYERRFRQEMTRQKFWLEGFAAHVRRGDTITLLCSSACVDEARCHRTIVKELLEEISSGPQAEPARPAARVVRRSRPA
ncbi:MAG: DUF488 family protein [Labilithrix sp.]|nr:DUF488 family protein [Labilithrix sp.]